MGTSRDLELLIVGPGAERLTVEAHLRAALVHDDGQPRALLLLDHADHDRLARPGCDVGGVIEVQVPLGAHPDPVLTNLQAQRLGQGRLAHDLAPHAHRRAVDIHVDDELPLGPLR